MPLTQATRTALHSIAVGQQVVDSRALSVWQDLQADEQAHGNSRQARAHYAGNEFLRQLDAVCENFADAALQPAGVLPSTVFQDILMTTAPPGWLPHHHRLFMEAQNIKNLIRTRFGGFVQAGEGGDFNYLVQNTTAARNAARPLLHQSTAKVFEHCLKLNGFTLSLLPSKYMVCMEYECAADQAMYPNHTHSWLMYDGKWIIQTITGACISISRHEAGRQPHCGLIRRYVNDFRPEQVHIIDEIMSHRHNIAAAETEAVTLTSATDIRTLQRLTKDRQSPNE